jgi:phosphoesterase RecJ-like protein
MKEKIQIIATVKNLILMNKETLEAAGQQIKNSNRTLIVSHIRPDGDAVGSVLGLGLALQEAGKDVQMVLSDGVPKNFRHLPGSEQICTRPEGKFDLVVVLDCSDLKRVGNALEEFPIPDLNVDHHITNLNFAKLNLVNVEAVSTTEILTEHIGTFGLSLSPRVATALLNGLITDTLGFRTENMSPKALRVAADLVEVGIDLPTLYRKALLSRSYTAARYWGAGLTGLKLEDRMLWTRLSLEDRKAVNYPGRDDADLINMLTNINDADIAMVFIEQTNGSVKVSWRSRPGYDVSELAFQFGGGGHKPAAGADIEGDLDDVIATVLEATRALLNGIEKNE